MLRELDLKDTLALKGAAILAIVFHSYFHLVSPVQENEFDFSPARFGTFLSSVQDPHQSLQSAFSYLGHFGVQVFIFLSAYGLAKRYWKTPAGIEFLRGRMRRIYPPFLAAIACWAVFVGLPQGPLGPLAVLGHQAKNLILTGLGISSFIPGHSPPPVSPWWFVPFTVQWYCLWPPMRRFADRLGPRGLMTLAAGAVLITSLANGPLAQWRINLLQTPIGHLPELCLGIIAARYPVRIHGGTILFAGAIFIASNLCASLWMLSFPSALAVIIAIYAKTRSTLRKVAPLFVPVGACSMGLFFLNGFVRFPFAWWASEGKTWAAVLVAGFLSAWLSLAMAMLMPKSPTSCRSGAT